MSKNMDCINEDHNPNHVLDGRTYFKRKYVLRTADNDYYELRQSVMDFVPEEELDVMRTFFDRLPLIVQASSMTSHVNDDQCFSRTSFYSRHGS